MARATAVLILMLALAVTVHGAGPCVHLRDWGSCTGYPTGECFWDSTDSRCENRGDNTESAGGGYCGKLGYWPCVSNSRRVPLWDGRPG